MRSKRAMMMAVKRQDVVECEAFGYPIHGRWSRDVPEGAHDAVVPEQRSPVWKIAYVVFMAGLLLLGVALVVVFTVWFITDPNPPLF